MNYLFPRFFVCFVREDLFTRRGKATKVVDVKEVMEKFFVVVEELRDEFGVDVEIIFLGVPRLSILEERRRKPEKQVVRKSNCNVEGFVRGVEEVCLERNLKLRNVFKEFEDRHVSDMYGHPSKDGNDEIARQLDIIFREVM
jgi:hypothetical protein